MEPQTKTFLYTEGKTFEDQTVYFSGHRYVDCQFTRCTMIVKDFDLPMTNCVIDSCIWHLDVLVHDHKMWAEFLSDFAIKIRDGLPRDPFGKASPHAP